jgi:hypothetical protein
MIISMELKWKIRWNLLCCKRRNSATNLSIMEFLYKVTMVPKKNDKQISQT